MTRRTALPRFRGHALVGTLPLHVSYVPTTRHSLTSSAFPANLPAPVNPTTDLFAYPLLPPVDPPARGTIIPSDSHDYDLPLDVIDRVAHWFIPQRELIVPQIGGPRESWLGWALWWGQSLVGRELGDRIRTLYATRLGLNRVLRGVWPFWV